MSRGKILFITIIVFSLLLLISIWGYNTLIKQYKPENNSSSTNDTNKKQLAPDFSVKDNNGKTVKLSDFKGKPIVLNFWASWCPPCRSEMPDYNNMYKKYKDKEVVFLMLNMTDGQRETISIANEYTKDNNFEFPIYFDVNGEASNAYAITSIPDSIFIDKNGYIIKTYTGGIDEATIEKNIELLLK